MPNAPASPGRHHRSRPLGRRYAALAALTGLGAMVGHAETVAAQLVEGVMAERIDSMFARYSGDASPGAVVLVAREGQIVFQRGYGLANLEEGRRLTPETPIRLGSLTKQFTAVAIMLLVEDGVLTVDELASKWVPELERFGPITLRHLLTHTSGLPDYYDRLASPGPGEAEPDLAAEGQDALMTGDDAVRTYRDWGELEFPIGSAYQYSNPGYEVLGLIVERASGRSYSDFMDERIFDPLGMSRSAVRDRPERVIADRAIGYRPRDGSQAWEELDDHPLNWILGAGGIYASAPDLVRWNAGLKSGRLLSSETLAEAFTPATLTGGTSHPYGYGWGLDEKLGRPAVHHTGGWVGFRTAMAHFPDDELLVVVLSNASGPAGDLLDGVAGLFLSAAGGPR